MVLFDGPHTCTNVALYAFLTGALFGAGAVAAYACTASAARNAQATSPCY